MQQMLLRKLTNSMWIYVLSTIAWTLALNTDVLWQSCTTNICGSRQLNIQCDLSSSILINDVYSGKGREFDQRSYLNLRRMCLGLSMCEPSRSGFCHTHSNTEFNVSYVCVREEDVEKECSPLGKPVSSNIGFITSPNYPAESRFKTCKWRINVPSGHYAHIFLHEVLPISSTAKFCHGLLFMAESTCGKFFPTFPICDESRVNTLISACSDMDIIMSANSTHSMRFWLSYYVVPVSDLRRVIVYDTDITCNTYKKDTILYRPIPQTTNSPVPVSSEFTTASNLTREVVESSGTEEDNTGVYVGVAVAVLVVVIIIIIIAILYIRYKKKRSEPKVMVPSSVSNSQDIQKRPLPEFQAKVEDPLADAVLQQGYSSVADELPPGEKPYNSTYSAYSEIEDCNEGGLKPQTKVINRRSIGSSERKLPATPDEEPYKSTYSEIENREVPYIAKITDKSHKDIRASRSKFEELKAKYEKDNNKEYEYKGGKKLSNASNIYAELPDVVVSDEKQDVNKTYVDMSHKPTTDSDRYKHINNKGIKDKFNLSKRSQGGTVETTDIKRNNGPRKVTPSWKKDSVTSAESDSDDDLCITENELYEPFESAKV